MAEEEIVEALVDEQILAEAQSVLEGLGLSVEDAIRLFLVRIAEDKAIPGGLA